MFVRTDGFAFEIAIQPQDQHVACAREAAQLIGERSEVLHAPARGGTEQAANSHHQLSRY
jgi:hypothetical protein